MRKSSVFFRVFPFVPGAKDTEPGGALYIPPQGGGRLDNPDVYSVLYLSDAAAGAVAEAFGRFPEWQAAMLEGSPALPGSVRAIAEYRMEGHRAICDLDDPKRLLSLGLRPSDVVSRDYGITRKWARRVYGRHRWIGVKWWSYYGPAWSSFGLWDSGSLKLDSVRPLRLSDVEVVEASRTIVRRIVRGRN